MEGVFPTNWNKEKWSEVGTEAALHICKLNYSVSLMTSFFFFCEQYFCCSFCLYAVFGLMEK